MDVQQSCNTRSKPLDFGGPFPRFDTAFVNVHEQQMSVRRAYFRYWIVSLDREGDFFHIPEAEPLFQVTTIFLALMHLIHTQKQFPITAWTILSTESSFIDGKCVL